MRVFKIGVNTNQSFAGDKKKNTVRNAVGTAAIAMATALPTEKADAQYYYPPPVIPPIGYYYNYQPAVEVPNCFIYGDINNFDYDKSLEDTFIDVDSKVKENGVISLNEVIAAERDNWNATHLYPYNAYQRNRTAANFNILSTMFNEEDSNPKTINFNEYKKIMEAYMEAKNVNTFFNLLRILTVPRIVCPPPHHHHHHHHRH